MRDSCLGSRKIKLITFPGFFVTDRKITFLQNSSYWLQYISISIFIINKGQQGIDMVRLWSLFGLKPLKNGKQRKKILIFKKVFPVPINLSQGSRAHTLWYSMATICMETVFAFNLVIKRAKSNKLRYSSTIIESPVLLILNVYP